MKTALELRLQSSRLAWAIVIFWHILPLACLLGEGVSWPIRGGVAATVAVSAGICWRQLGRWRMHSLCLQPSGEAFLRSAGQTTQAVTMLPDCLDLGWLVLLHWRDEQGGQGRQCLLRDACMPDDWRALRAWLRWQRIEHEA